jgi:ribosomal protein S15P/S13E
MEKPGMANHVLWMKHTDKTTTIYLAKKNQKKKEDTGDPEQDLLLMEEQIAEIKRLQAQ